MIVVTGGGTQEYLDDVRVLTNISTGALSAAICDFFTVHGQKVVYVKAKGAYNPHMPVTQIIEIRSVAELVEELKLLVPKADTVIHAMAVSDFTFERKGNIKLKSNSPEDFVKYISEAIRLNPKVISFLREWNPKAYLVGFKFEVGKTTEELMEIATNLLKKNDLDLVVANDKAEMERLGIHKAYILNKNGSYDTIPSADLSGSSILSRQEQKLLIADAVYKKWEHRNG